MYGIEKEPGFAGYGGAMQAAKPMDQYADTPQQINALAQHMGEMDRLIGGVHCELDELTQRLSPFVRPAPPEVGGPGVGGTTQTRSQSPVSETIARHNGELSRAMSRVRALIARIDG